RRSRPPRDTFDRPPRPAGPLSPVPRRTLRRRFRHPRSTRPVKPSFGNAVAERIARIKQEVRLGRNKRRAFDRRDDLAVFDSHLPFKNAANDALLAPDIPWRKFSIRIEARQLCAGPRAARRPVIHLSRAQNEILAVDSGRRRRTEQLNVIDLLPVRPRDAVLFKRLTNCPRELR